MGLCHDDAVSDRWASANGYAQVGAEIANFVAGGCGLIGQPSYVFLLLPRESYDT